jgi:hypothetical protein
MHQSGGRAIGRNTHVPLRLANVCVGRSGDRAPEPRGCGVAEDALAVGRTAEDADRAVVVPDEARFAPGEEGERETEREWQDMHGGLLLVELTE